tara:strand:+ start:2993 stop:3889 length:897 start_codon:yes stop_codon:yes gene_type:complete
VAKQKKKTGIEHLENNPINWFPGHMNKAVQEIKSHIKSVNIILEVRDARAPLVSGNKGNYSHAGDKPYLIILNKTNLADPEAVKLWQDWFTKQNESFIFINALDKSSIKTIIKRAKEILLAHRLKSNPDATDKEDMKMMIIGLPNTGKSTIINKLSNRNASKAAATPGQTKQKLWVKVDPHLSILDTPGVMPPKIEKEVHGMWLSAIHAIPDHITTPDYSACFLVEYFLKKRSSVFQEHYEFESLDIDLITAVNHIGKRRGCLRHGGNYDYDHIYKIILADFRSGALGLISFELPPIS